MNKPVATFATGIIRKLDRLGRVVVPIEIRRNLDLDSGDCVEITTDGNSVTLKKFELGPKCVVTGKDDGQLIPLLDGKLHLSDEGCRILLREMQTKM